jgi:APA family basic amino acid/polyamine antiporter
VILAILALENPFTLLLYTGMAYWGFAALTGMAVMVLRRRDPLRKRPFRVWAYPLTPILFIAAALGMAVSVIAADVNNKTRNGLAAAIILAVGAIVYGIQRLAFRDRSRSAAPASADLS